MTYLNSILQYPSIHGTVQYTQKMLSVIKTEISNALCSSKEFTQYLDTISIITTGSYGRDEASENSDLDIFILSEKILDENQKSILSELLTSLIQPILQRHICKDNGSSNTFGTKVITSISELSDHVGGISDSNQNLTRRMLTILEGRSLFNDNLFENLRNILLTKYISINENELTRYFLNDLIRYYRTITTDFQRKMDDGQDWGLRNIKLKFSRKLIYFSGITIVYELLKFDTSENKITRALELIKIPPLERLYSVFNEYNSEQISQIFKEYDSFLEALERDENRKILNNCKKENKDECELYKELNQKSKKYEENFLNIINTQNYRDYPFINALIC